mgnify:CR=1 FL=1
MNVTIWMMKSMQSNIILVFNLIVPPSFRIAKREKEIVVDDEGEIFGEGDEYDYSQHLRPLGTAGGLFIPAPEFPEDIDRFKQKREKKKRLPKDFPQEVLPNVRPGIYSC